MMTMGATTCVLALIFFVVPDRAVPCHDPLVLPEAGATRCQVTLQCLL